MNTALDPPISASCIILFYSQSLYFFLCQMVVSSYGAESITWKHLLVPLASSEMLANKGCLSWSLLMPCIYFHLKFFLLINKAAHHHHGKYLLLVPTLLKCCILIISDFSAQKALRPFCPLNSQESITSKPVVLKLGCTLESPGIFYFI